MTARRAKKLLRTAEKRKWKENLAFCKRQLQKAVNSGEADCYCDALAKNADRVQAYFDKKGFKTERRWSPYDGYCCIRVIILEGEKE